MAHEAGDPVRPRGDPARRSGRGRPAVLRAGQEKPVACQGYMEGYLVYMAPEEGGRIERLTVDSGDPVSEGQMLFTLESSVQIAQRNEVEARLRQAEAQLANLKAALQRPEQIAIL